MEDWDWDNPTEKRVEVMTVRGEGKIFGHRGRGFQLASSRNEAVFGGTPQKNLETNNNWPDDKENRDNHWDEDWSDTWEPKGNGHQRGHHGEYDRDVSGKHSCGYQKEMRNGENRSKPKKPQSAYIPEEPTEDEHEIFGNSISSGINFSKYDDIEVRVSGENPPEPMNCFGEAGLHNFLTGLIRKCKYRKPTPIQRYAIPIIMNGRDLMACSQTGSGKTAAFLIPIINNLLESKQDVHTTGVCKPLAVIVSPTRELCIQIFDEARKFSLGSFLKITIAYGGTSVRYQKENVMKGCHILVATMGRLMDFVQKGLILFTSVKFVVLDEADQMLDLGFLPKIESLMTDETMVARVEKQTLMFSATFPEEVQRIAGKFLKDYLFVAVGIVGGACTDVEQRFFPVTKFEKRNKLVELLRENGGKKCLVFVGQKRATDFLATFLSEKNFPATSIHGDREQREREEALRDFKRGKMDILVATSVAARGLDINGVAHVINFDLPKTVDEYVHRIGRTGRVGNRGLATSFFDPKKDKPLVPYLVKILTQAGQIIPDCLKDNDSHGGLYEEASEFGGSDFRNPWNGAHCDLGVALNTTFEEEEW